MPMELISRGLLTNAVDVFSFGVLCHEASGRFHLSAKLVVNVYAEACSCHAPLCVECCAAIQAGWAACMPCTCRLL